jgi:hypothetical protein
MIGGADAGSPSRYPSDIHCCSIAFSESDSRGSPVQSKRGAQLSSVRALNGGIAPRSISAIMICAFSLTLS